MAQSPFRQAKSGPSSPNPKFDRTRRQTTTIIPKIGDKIQRFHEFEANPPPARASAAPVPASPKPKAATSPPPSPTKTAPSAASKSVESSPYAAQNNPHAQQTSASAVTADSSSHSPVAPGNSSPASSLDPVIIEPKLEHVDQSSANVSLAASETRPVSPVSPVAPIDHIQTEDVPQTGQAMMGADLKESHSEPQTELQTPTGSDALDELDQFLLQENEGMVDDAPQLDALTALEAAMVEELDLLTSTTETLKMPPSGSFLEVVDSFPVAEVQRESSPTGSETSESPPAGREPIPAVESRTPPDPASTEAELVTEPSTEPVLATSQTQDGNDSREFTPGSTPSARFHSS